MRHKYWPGYFIIFMLCNSSLDTVASSWMRTSGNSLFHLSINNSDSSSFWDKDRILNQSCDANSLSSYLHYEYGYSYYHTLFGATRVERNSCDNFSSQGIPDVEVGIRGRLNKFRNGQTWELSAILPVQGDADDSSKPGNGEVGLRAGLYLMFLPDPYLNPYESIKSGIWTVGLQTIYWTGDAAHEIEGEAAWKHPVLDTDWQFEASIKGLHAFGGTDKVGYDPSDRYRAIDTDKLKVRLKFSTAPAKHYWLSISVGQDIWGRNTSRGTDLRFSISRSWE